MELTFPKSDIAYLGRILHEHRNVEQTQEIRLSDGMPDIGRVLGCWGIPLIRGKEWRSNRIAVNGGVMVWALYAPEDGTDPRCAESWIPFQMEWDIRDTDREGQIRVRPLLRFADARSVSARKLMIRTGVAALAEAFVPMQAQISTADATEPDIQLLENTYPLRLQKYAGEKTFLFDEELTIPSGSPAADKLISFGLRPEITEQRVTGDRVVFRGNANLRILYRCKEGKLHTWDFSLPFSQLGDLPDVLEGDAQADAVLCATSLEVNPEDDGHIRVKCGLLAQYAVSCREFVNLAQDAYSVTREVLTQTELLELPVILEDRQENLYGEQTLPQNGQTVVDVQFFPDFPRKRINGNAVDMELPGQFQVLYYGEDGMLQSSAARWEGNFRMPVGEDTVTDAQVFLKEPASAAFSGGRMVLKANMTLNTQTWTDQEIPFVSGLEVGEPCQINPGRPSLILRRMGGEGLWVLAKKSGSTVEAICKANSLQGEPEQGQMLLIPIN